MEVEKTRLEGCLLIHDTFMGDKRGYFFESFNRKRFYEKTGVDTEFVQDNQSLSQKGVLRGLHYQLGAFAQAKLVRVIRGRVLDVAVDLRAGSATFGEYIAVELQEDDHQQFFIPRGFAHGFVVLSEEAVFFYKVDNYYNKEAEGGIMYNDPEIGIDWQMQDTEIILSEKDKVLPFLSNIKDTLNFHT